MTDAPAVQILALEPKTLTVPSGQEVTALDVVLNAPGPTGPATRFRFLAPSIARDGGSVDFALASGDMLALCQDFALTKLSALNVSNGQVIISLSDRAVEFGQSDEAATQFFEAYRIEDGACIWEAF
jgi:hypothetical protein